MNESATCCICATSLWDDEHGRWICRPCEKRLSLTLKSIAGPTGLYARLCLRTEPGKTGNGPTVSGTRGSKMPPNETILSLITNGGIVSDLETWVADWATYGLATTRTGNRLQYRVDQAVQTLRLNLPQAALRHPALDEFHAEIGAIARRCKAIVDGEKPPIRLRVTCPCGHAVPFTINTEGETCHGCGTEHSRRDIFNLQLTERRAAA